MASDVEDPTTNLNPESPKPANSSQNVTSETGNTQMQTPQPSTPLGSATSNAMEQPKSKWSSIKTKNFIFLLVLVFLLIGLSVIGIFYLAGNNKSNELKTVEPTSATLGWKTYEDQSLAFSVKYPPDWIYSNQKPSWDEGGITNKILFSGTKSPLETITVYKLLWKFSLDSFVDTELSQFLDRSEKGESLVVGDQEARQFEKSLIDRDEDASGEISTLIKRGDDMFVIESFIQSEEGKNIYNEFLKTIVFGQKKEDAKQTEVKLTNTYTNPTFGYTIKIPDGWRETQSDDEQKTFRFYTEKQSSGKSDEIGFFKAEIQILTEPAVSGDSADFNKRKALKTGEEMIIGGMIIKKIEDLKIDGKDAIYLLGKSGGLALSVTILGEKRYISIALKGYDQDTLDKHRAEFEAAVNTFKFNNFNLD